MLIKKSTWGKVNNNISSYSYTTNGLACRLQEIKAITQVLKEKIPPSPKDEDNPSVQFITLEKEYGITSETSKITVRANQQGIQPTTTKGKTTKKSLITTSDMPSLLLKANIEPPHSSEQQPSPSSNNTKKRKKRKNKSW